MSTFEDIATKLEEKTLSSFHDLIGGSSNTSNTFDAKSIFMLSDAHFQWFQEMDKRKVKLSRNMTEKTFDGDAPSWPPTHKFAFPIVDIPVLIKPIKDMGIDDFTEVRELGEGSSGKAYVARYCGTEVIIKQLKEEVANEDVCIHEFDQELGLLARVNYPNIVHVIGSGVVDDRRFIVMQYLGGGTLQKRFNETTLINKVSFLYKKHTFTFPDILHYARQLAGALNYLHNEIHPDAVFIHRDLKPDNIAFLEDGNLVLFDFGLTTVIKRGATSDVAYQMTGETGSLRYMAPEVALNMPYNEKVDQYSFGVILWEMATDLIPFDGSSRASYLEYTCKLGDRPDVPSSLPTEFKSLLENCWHQDFTKRPKFSDVCCTLDILIEAHPLFVSK